MKKDRERKRERERERELSAVLDAASLRSATRNAHGITVLMNYGSLTYTPMQNRIPSMCNVGNRKLSDRLCAVQRNPLQQKKIPPDPPVHLSERSAVLVRTRSRLVEVCAVKVVRSRVARTRGNGTSAALLSLALPDFPATNRPWIPCRKLWRKSPSTTPDIEPRILQGRFFKNDRF